MFVGTKYDISFKLDCTDDLRDGGLDVVFGDQLIGSIKFPSSPGVSVIVLYVLIFIIIAHHNYLHEHYHNHYHISYTSPASS